MQQLQGMDASFVALETRNSPMHIGNILLYDPATAPGGFVRFKDILRFYESRMQLSKTMRRRLVRVPFDLDYPYWVEDASFDLEYHAAAGTDWQRRVPILTSGASTPVAGSASRQERAASVCLFSPRTRHHSLTCVADASRSMRLGAAE